MQPEIEIESLTVIFACLSAGLFAILIITSGISARQKRRIRHLEEEKDSLRNENEAFDIAVDTLEGANEALVSSQQTIGKMVRIVNNAGRAAARSMTIGPNGEIVVCEGSAAMEVARMSQKNDESTAEGELKEVPEPESTAEGDGSTDRID